MLSSDFIRRHGRKMALACYALTLGSFITFVALLLIGGGKGDAREIGQLVGSYLLFAASAAGGFALANSGVEIAHTVRGTASPKAPPSESSVPPAPRESGTVPAAGDPS